MPRQHLRKPGHEAKMNLKPRFMAIHYRGSAKLEGKVALITGGDSGIGRAVAVLFAREGADVAIVYLNEHDDALETQAYVEREGGRCVLIPGDVRHARFCERAVAKTVKALGGIDILVNNSAFQEHAESIEEVSEARFDLTLKTNVYGYFQMAKAAVPYLTEGSAIINTGSVTGLEGSAHLLDYSTTKGAIHALTKSLARNLLPRGIRVNAVAPGPVLDSIESCRQAAEPDHALWPRYGHEAGRPARGNLAGLRVPRLPGMLWIHHGNSAADNRQRQRLLNPRPCLVMVPHRCSVQPFWCARRMKRVRLYSLNVDPRRTQPRHPLSLRQAG